MRPAKRVLIGAGLAALLSVLAAAPAGATPPNEVRIARALQEQGVLAPYATAAMTQAAVAAFAGTPSDAGIKPPVSASDARSTSLGEFLTARQTTRAAASAYVSPTLVLLVEFGDDPWPAGSAEPNGPSLPGPAHGEIAPPAPQDADVVFWPGDFSVAHYQEMLFGDSFPIFGQPVGTSNLPLRGTSRDTLRAWLLGQSHGAYTLDGDVYGWVKLDLPQSWYGADGPGDAIDALNGPRWRVVRDAVLAFAAQNPGFDWARYDQENPWGITGPAFRQPDGYIDHLMIVHAGPSQTSGGGAYGTSALDAEGWTVLDNANAGPGGNSGTPIPGTEGQGPQGKGIWAGRYVIAGEDDAIGSFAYSLGRTLGLDRQWDRSSTIEDASGFWTVMAAGCWLGGRWGLGTTPAPMNADDKALLGFVTPKIVARGATATVRLQPAAGGSAYATAVKIALPAARHPVALSGADGSREWYALQGDNRQANLTLTEPVAVAPGADLSFRTWYDTEKDFDFGYVQVSVDGGATWETIDTVTGTDTAHWQDVRTVDLAAYEGRPILVRFRYVTDGSIQGRGWEVADVAIGAVAPPEAAWTATDWVLTDGSYTFRTTQYYIAEYRGNGGADEATRRCYEFRRDTPGALDRFSYNRGLHLIYRDTYYNDNDVSQHPGYGAHLVVDAHPRADGIVRIRPAAYWRPRIQLRDAAFSITATPAQRIWFRDYATVTDLGERTAPGKGAQSWFNDTWKYWRPEIPTSGVKVPRLGVRIQVRTMDAKGMTLWVDNRP